VPVPDLRGLQAVFLDRDGTLNVKAAAGEYIRNPADLVLLPGAARAVAALNAARLRTVLVTNQRWLSDQSADPASYAAVHARLEHLLAREGGRLDAAYHCPHAAGACDCRKPAAGMLRRAAAEHGFDLSRAVIVGDSHADMAAGRAAGTAAILLRAGSEGAASADAVVKDLGAGAEAATGADVVAEDLRAAVRLILRVRTDATDAA
jgi:D-glycero-D-manno-heptose 1,7-bisphosphate phosphatase